MTQKRISQLLLLTVIALSLLGGYFHARYKTQQRYNGILKRQVRELKEQLYEATQSATLESADTSDVLESAVEGS